MRTLSRFFVMTFFLSVLSCKNDKRTTDNFDYKYADVENTLKCDGINTKLYHEALMSFEDDIMKTYNTRNTDIRVAHTTFFRTAQRNQVNYQELVSPHTMKVFEALKSDQDLWTENNKLNYNADIFTCIGNNISDKGLATTYKALISTNSMRADLIGAPLQNKVKTANSDRYLATFIALEYFYSKLHNVDPNQVKENDETNNEVKKTESSKALINTKTNEANNDPHAGHNHD